MRPNLDPRFPMNPPDGWASALLRALTDYLRSVVQRIHDLSDGRIAATDNKATAAPTTGTWARGDFVRNSEPSEAGSASSKYVVIGWVCVTAGTPGTWVACRFLTGN